MSSSTGSQAQVSCQRLLRMPVSLQRRRKRNRPPVWMVVGIILVIVCLCAGASILVSGSKKKARQATVTAQALVLPRGFTPAVCSLIRPQPILLQLPIRQPHRSRRRSRRRARLKLIWSALQVTGTISQTGLIESRSGGRHNSRLNLPRRISTWRLRMPNKGHAGRSPESLQDSRRAVSRPGRFL